MVVGLGDCRLGNGVEGDATGRGTEEDVVGEEKDLVGMVVGLGDCRLGNGVEGKTNLGISMNLMIFDGLLKWVFVEFGFWKL
ncbi:hypothetical protein SLE2022_361600 [Rubroshorea leprosula]